jgi:hypothetical protein
MKIFITLFICSYTLISEAQNVKNENNIKELKTLNIYGQNNKVIVGKIIINQSVNKQLFLKKLTQVRDSSGIYLTTIILDTPEDPRVVGYSLLLEFDKPVMSVDAYNGILSGGAIIGGLDKTKKRWSEKATELNINKVFGGYTIIIKSESLIKTTIHGIAGKMAA